MTIDPSKTQPHVPCWDLYYTFQYAGRRGSTTGFGVVSLSGSAECYDQGAVLPVPLSVINDVCSAVARDAPEATSSVIVTSFALVWLDVPTNTIGRM